MIKKVEVLTSGGDCARDECSYKGGRTAQTDEIAVVGIRRVLWSHSDEEFVDMDYSSVGGIMEKGGTVLEVPDAKSSRPRKVELGLPKS